MDRCNPTDTFLLIKDLNLRLGEGVSFRFVCLVLNILNNACPWSDIVLDASFFLFVLMQFVSCHVACLTGVAFAFRFMSRHLLASSFLWSSGGTRLTKA